MKFTTTVLGALVALLLLLGDARAQSLRTRVNEAIDRGVENLFDTQQIDGSWYLHRPRYRAGQTALSVYALLACGVEPKHPAIRRALLYLDVAEPYYTYEVSVTVIAYLELLERLGAADADLRDDLNAKIERYVEMLVEYQADSGGWAYPDGAIDMSNAQYAGMALRNAARAGFDVPRGLWKDLARYVMSVQEREVRGSRPVAGVMYRAEGHEPSGSMTAAGIATLHLCEEQYGRPLSKWVRHKEAALRWLEEHFQVADNPGTPGAWHFYYLYTVERVGAYLERETFGDMPWYEAGATWLVEHQRDSGDWWNDAQTCFALLFLKRATAPSTGGEDGDGPVLSFGTDDPNTEVNVRAFGENPLRIWLSSFGDIELEEYGVEGDDGLPTLDVVSCEYWIDSGPRVDEPRLLRRIDEDQSASRFMIEHEFERRGTYTLRGVVRIRSPHEADGIVELESEPLEVVARRDDQTRLLAVAESLSRNQLLDAEELTARVSSIRGDDFGARYAADGTLTSGWVTDERDPRPWIHFAWKEELRTGSLRFAHVAEVNASDTVLPKRLLVTIDGRDEYFVEMPNDRDEFGYVVFESREEIEGLRVEIVEIHPHPENRTGPTGLGEVALHPSTDR